MSSNTHVTINLHASIRFTSTVSSGIEIHMTHHLYAQELQDLVKQMSASQDKLLQRLIDEDQMEPAATPAIA